MKPNFRGRIRLISISIFVFSLVIIGRLYFLQVVDNDKYLDKAARQYSSTAKNIFSRGSIFFENKDGTLVSAATLKSGYVIAINPEILKDPEGTYLKLNEIIPTDHDSFMAKAGKKKDPYEEIAVRTDESVGEKVTALKIQGLQAIKDRWRFYPGEDTAAHIIGIMGYKGDDYAGRYGLESQFDGNLERKDGGYVNFFAQIFAGIKTATASTTKSEADIVTTIEPVVESYLETLLASTTEKWNSDSSGGIIMNPNTGEIYAMEVYPTFDPNHPEKEKNVKVFSDPLIEDVYEMGSILKPLTISAGLDAGVITPSSTYYDAGFVMVNGQKIKKF
jgi:stage V sporulation protein D (sporulation-specific penicillin-binding protein)